MVLRGIVIVPPVIMLGLFLTLVADAPAILLSKRVSLETISPAPFAARQDAWSLRSSRRSATPAYVSDTFDAAGSTSEGFCRVKLANLARRAWWAR